ncbi:MAG: RDD family protein [Chloroflexi bacterium]|nr:RDD family protein [Chloroflexota bacterium]MCY3587526.1 RDD family protein [Chloroflexota bacterium]MCY3685557.1 RDD family protein [Chloroflexota bacterium]MDE2708459.1 RDD family protein [Chloroflexota bacterium]
MSTPRPRALRSEHCPACDDYPGVGAFCSACGVLASHPTSGDYAAPYLRRLAGELLDLLIFLLLPIWLYWMWFTSREGQSPAKSLLDLYVIAESGQPITPQRMWVRELLIKRLLLGLIGYLFTLLGPIINAGWILLNPDRQCVHDRMVGTLVVVRRQPPELAQPSPDFEQQEVRLPPPAPRGPRVKPPPPTIRGLPENDAPPPEPQPRPPISSPELEALEGERLNLSQTEYERRRRRLLRQLEESD